MITLRIWLSAKMNIYRNDKQWTAYRYIKHNYLKQSCRTESGLAEMMETKKWHMNLLPKFQTELFLHYLDQIYMDCLPNNLYNPKINMLCILKCIGLDKLIKKWNFWKW